MRGFEGQRGVPGFAGPRGFTGSGRQFLFNSYMQLSQYYMPRLYFAQPEHTMTKQISVNCVRNEIAMKCNFFEKYDLFFTYFLLLFHSLCTMCLCYRCQ